MCGPATHRLVFWSATLTTVVMAGVSPGAAEPVPTELSGLVANMIRNPPSNVTEAAKRTVDSLSAIVFGTEIAAAPGPGDLDSTFSQDGIVTTLFQLEEAGAYTIAIQPDGKILAAGLEYEDDRSNCVLARLNPNGTFDATFGSGGKVITNTTNVQSGPYFEQINQLALQPDGKIIASGWTNPTIDNTADFLLLRYNTNGTLDSTFGTGGIVSTHVQSTYWLWPGDLAIQQDGKILVSGSADDGTGNSSSQMVVLRYGPTGTLDSSFGTSGILRVNYGGWVHSAASSLAVRPDGKILVAGYAQEQYGGITGFGVVRLNVNGTLDSTFGVGGAVYTTFPGTYYLGAIGNSIVLQPDLRFIVCGNTGGYDFDAIMARYNADGSLDASFGSGGKLTLDFSDDWDWGEDVVIQPDGKLVVLGVGEEGATFVARLSASGTFDSSFGENGVAQVNDIFGVQLALQSDGKIAFAGYDSPYGEAGHFMVARLLNSAAAPNQAPVIQNQSFSIPARSPVGAAVGTVVASDPDIGQSLTYAITSGNRGSAFKISAQTGALTVNKASAVRRPSTFSLKVKVTDNGSPVLSDDATVTVNVTNGESQ